MKRNIPDHLQALAPPPPKKQKASKSVDRADRYNHDFGLIHRNRILSSIESHDLSGYEQVNETGKKHKKNQNKKKRTNKETRDQNLVFGVQKDVLKKKKRGSNVKEKIRNKEKEKQEQKEKKKQSKRLTKTRKLKTQLESKSRVFKSTMKSKSESKRKNGSKVKRIKSEIASEPYDPLEDSNDYSDLSDIDINVIKSNKKSGDIDYNNKTKSAKTDSVKVEQRPKRECTKGVCYTYSSESDDGSSDSDSDRDRDRDRNNNVKAERKNYKKNRNGSESKSLEKVMKDATVVEILENMNVGSEFAVGNGTSRIEMEQFRLHQLRVKKIQDAKKRSKVKAMKKANSKNLNENSNDNGCDKNKRSGDDEKDNCNDNSNKSDNNEFEKDNENNNSQLKSMSLTESARSCSLLDVSYIRDSISMTSLLEPNGDSKERLDYANTDISGKKDLCVFHPKKVFAVGSTKIALLGEYTKGIREGQQCVVKKHIRHRARNENDYKRELMAQNQGLRFAKSWFKFIKSKSNKDNTNYKIIYIVQPMPTQNITETDPTLSDIENANNNDKNADIVVVNQGKNGMDNDDNINNGNKNNKSNNNNDSDDIGSSNGNCNKTSMRKTESKLVKRAKKVYRDEWIMVEPFLAGKFTKFNCNNGQVGAYKDHVLQAFSHHTYHVSNGQMVLADVQGVEKEDMIILTDICILSRKSGMFGEMDLGEDGLVKFMMNHECNQYCDPKWLKPDLEAIEEELNHVRNPAFMRLDIDFE